MRASAVSHCDQTQAQWLMSLSLHHQAKKVFCEGKCIPVQKTFLFWRIYTAISGKRGLYVMLYGK